MITTITLNPAIDKTLIVENFALDNINRVKEIYSDAGGKAINASKVIKSLDEETTALGFLGGATGKELLKKLENKGIICDFVWLNENTRTNIKVVDTLNNTCTDINAAGPYVDLEKLSEFKEKLHSYIYKSDIIILSGNAQDSIPVTIYKEIIEEFSDKKIMLDTSGNLLKEAIKAKPWFIKPNINELSELLNKELKDMTDIIAESRKLNEFGIEYVCVSMGEKGILLTTKNEIILATPPKIKAKSTVGAGDSIVGSMAVSLLRNEPLLNALKYACAISAASVTISGTDVPDKNVINSIYKNVSVSKI